MPIYNEKYCSICHKLTMHMYIPRLTFKESYWKCSACNKEDPPIVEYKYRNKSKEHVPGYVKALRIFSS